MSNHAEALNVPVELQLICREELIAQRNRVGGFCSFCSATKASSSGFDCAIGPIWAGLPDAAGASCCWPFLRCANVGTARASARPATNTNRFPVTIKKLSFFIMLLKKRAYSTGGLAVKGTRRIAPITRIQSA
jgi:hypothetical protein